MKKNARIAKMVVIAHHYMLAAIGLFHLLKDLPIPDFNNQYDATIL